MFRSLSMYQLFLFALLSSLMVSAGLESNAVNVVLPLVGKDFDVGVKELGASLSIMSFGAVAAFFVMRLADRYGRRPLFLISIASFGGFTLLSALTRSMPEFVFCQFGAKVFMQVQIGLSYILLNEAMEGSGRGRMSGLMAAFATLGVAMPAFLLAPLVEAGIGWRGLYVVAALPLLLLPIAMLLVRESDLYRNVPRQSTSISLVGEVRVLLGERYRRRFLALSGLWFIYTMANGAQQFFFSLFVFSERGWTAEDLQVIAPLGLAVSFVSYFLLGWLGDRVGRRRVVGGGLCVAVLISYVCYQSADRMVLILCWLGLDALNALQPLLWVLTAELFPTEIRAAASALSNNLIGRWGAVIGSASVSVIAHSSESLSFGIMAVSTMGLLAIPLVLLLPETKGAELALVHGDAGQTDGVTNSKDGGLSKHA